MKLFVATLVSLLLGAVVADQTNLRAGRQLNDPRTVIEKELEGYVCSMGGDLWTNDMLLQHLDSFVQITHERNEVFATIDPTKKNWGGNGLFHAFNLWATLRNVKPTMVVESGVFNGATSWLIEKATAEWKPILVFVDPDKKGWEPSTAVGRTIHDFRGEGRFKDFTELPWDSIQADRSNALVFFDDHMDHLRRLKEAHTLGFGHAMFDDNYIAGTGDMYSIKDACDRDGRVRAAFQKSPGLPFRQCDMFHRQCTELTPEKALQNYAELDALADILWEGPPLTELAKPYASILNFMKKGHYEGPKEWNEAVHGKLVRESSKPPLFSDPAKVLELFKINLGDLDFETSRYVNVVYIKLHVGPLAIATA